MVFYFTGTGNSLYIAKRLDANPVSIPQILKCDNLTFEDERIGIVCPIYGHEMPGMVKEFIRRATFKTSYLYVILTYGNIHANAAQIADRAFKAAGKTADYITTLLMVDNFLPAFDMREQMALDKRVDEQLARIQAELFEQKREIQKATRKDQAIHKMYLDHVQNQPETIWASFRITDECVGCGICTKVCPAGCIRLESQKAIQTQENCQACMACIHACPQMAIQLNLPEKNARARYRNEHVSLAEIVSANNQLKR